MPSVSLEQKIAIIQKHCGDKVYMIIKGDDGLEFFSGPLVSADAKSITVKDVNKGPGNISAPLVSADRRVVALFNSQFIDLVKLKEPTVLSVKLGGDLKRPVIQNLKPHMKDVLYFVYKNKESLAMCKGKLVDMGLAEFIISIAPFYNDNLRLNYRNVTNIYSGEGIDLTDVAKPA